MTGFPKPPISKNLSKAKIQDISKYGNFTERFNTALKQDRFSLFSRSTFDRKTKFEISRRRAILFLRLVFWISAISIIILLVSGLALEQVNSRNIFWILVATILGCVFVGSWFSYNRLKHRPESHSSGGLTEETTDLEKANYVQEWAQKTIKNKKRIFIMDDVSGNIYDFSDVLLNARNNIMPVIGDEYHRKALGVAGHIPDGPLLYLIEDEETIFQDLEDKLFPKSKPEPEPEPEAKLKPKRISLDVDKKSKAIRRRIETAKKRGTYYKKVTKKTHDYLHLQATLNRHDMMKLFVDYSKTDDFWENVAKGNPTRELWTEVFIFIYKNWNKWLAYTHSPNTKSEFIDTLFGPNFLNIERSSPARKKFRLGKHREMSNFIIECYIIPVSELGKDPQRDLFRDKIQD